MVRIRRIPESDFPVLRRLHNDYTASDESLDAIRDRYHERPELQIGAYQESDLVGYCLGSEYTDSVAQLEGIAVVETHQRRGIGSDLLTTFEENAASLGFGRVTLGSAGGYVDEFYLKNGYEAVSVLVRIDEAEARLEYPVDEYDVGEERVEDGVWKLYVEVAEHDSSFLDEVQEAFGDPEAIYIMEKDIELKRTS